MPAGSEHGSPERAPRSVRGEGSPTSPSLFSVVQSRPASRGFTSTRLMRSPSTASQGRASSPGGFAASARSTSQQAQGANTQAGAAEGLAGRPESRESHWEAHLQRSPLFQKSPSVGGNLFLTSEGLADEGGDPSLRRLFRDVIKSRAVLLTVILNATVTYRHLAGVPDEKDAAAAAASASSTPARPATRRGSALTSSASSVTGITGASNGTAAAGSESRSGPSTAALEAAAAAAVASGDPDAAAAAEAALQEERKARYDNFMATAARAQAYDRSKLEQLTVDALHAQDRRWAERAARMVEREKAKLADLVRDATEAHEVEKAILVQQIVRLKSTLQGIKQPFLFVGPDEKKEADAKLAELIAASAALAAKAQSGNQANKAAEIVDALLLESLQAAGLQAPAAGVVRESAVSATIAARQFGTAHQGSLSAPEAVTPPRSRDCNHEEAAVQVDPSDFEPLTPPPPPPAHRSSQTDADPVSSLSDAVTELRGELHESSSALASARGQLNSQNQLMNSLVEESATLREQLALARRRLEASEVSRRREVADMRKALIALGLTTAGPHAPTLEGLGLSDSLAALVSGPLPHVSGPGPLTPEPEGGLGGVRASVAASGIESGSSSSGAAAPLPESPSDAASASVGFVAAPLQGSASSSTSGGKAPAAAASARERELLVRIKRLEISLSTAYAHIASLNAQLLDTSREKAFGDSGSGDFSTDAVAVRRRPSVSAGSDAAQPLSAGGGQDTSASPRTVDAQDRGAQAPGQDERAHPRSTNQTEPLPLSRASIPPLAFAALSDPKQREETADHTIDHQQSTAFSASPSSGSVLDAGFGVAADNSFRAGELSTLTAPGSGMVGDASDLDPPFGQGLHLQPQPQLALHQAPPRHSMPRPQSSQQRTILAAVPALQAKLSQAQREKAAAEGDLERLAVVINEARVRIGHLEKVNEHLENSVAQLEANQNALLASAAAGAMALAASGVSSSAGSRPATRSGAILGGLGDETALAQRAPHRSAAEMLSLATRITERDKLKRELAKAQKHVQVLEKAHLAFRRDLTAADETIRSLQRERTLLMNQLALTESRVDELRAMLRSGARQQRNVASAGRSRALSATSIGGPPEGFAAASEAFVEDL